MPGFSEWCSRFYRWCTCCGCCCEDETRDNLLPVNPSINSFGSLVPSSRAGSLPPNASSGSFASPLSRRTSIDVNFANEESRRINACLIQLVNPSYFSKTEQRLLRGEQSKTRDAFISEFINPGNLEVVSSSAYEE